MNLPVIIVAFVLSGALAIFGVEANIPIVQIIFKPVCTALLFLIVGLPRTRYTKLVAAGIFFSLVGDVALLSNSNLFFIIGLAGFLIAHVAYSVGFFMKAVWSPRMLAFIAVVGAATTFLVVTVAPGAQGLLLPVILYGTAISTMVVGAFSCIGGKLPIAGVAAAGAVLFYISDSSLAINRFYVPIPHVAYLTLGVYWLGQLGIALTGRAEAGYAPFNANSAGAAPTSVLTPHA
ncbi:MAG TPA: lysoplasmalogenase [Myxococcaceae bacterium]|nr:lysoplasmalogenase [Myxococcaceae bacterium]